MNCPSLQNSASLASPSEDCNSQWNLSKEHFTSDFSTRGGSIVIPRGGSQLTAASSSAGHPTAGQVGHSSATSTARRSGGQAWVAGAGAWWKKKWQAGCSWLDWRESAAEAVAHLQKHKLLAHIKGTQWQAEDACYWRLHLKDRGMLMLIQKLWIIQSSLMLIQRMLMVMNWCLLFSHVCFSAMSKLLLPCDIVIILTHWLIMLTHQQG